MRVDPAPRKEATADKTEGAALDRTLKEAVKPTNKRLAEKGVKETPALGVNPELTSSEDDTSDGSGDDSPTEPGSKRSKVAGRGPGEPLTHIAAPENIAVDVSNDHSLKDIGDPKDLSKETGLNDIAADALLRKTQRIRKETRKGESF